MFNPANKAHFSLTVGGMEKGTGLQVLCFEGKEIISKPYQFEITLVNRNIRFDITQLLSKPAYLAFTPCGKNGVHGVIMSVQRGAVGHDYAEYRAILAPRFTHLEKRTNQRIFQHKTVPQIISQILSEYGILEGTQHEFRLKEEYPQRDYCVQYDETDAHFIQRLCQEEGIFYYFQHDKSNHLMIFGDSNPVFGSLKKALRYASGTGFVADIPVIKAFNVNLTSKTKRATWRDYNYTNTKIPEGQAEGKQSAKANGALEPDIEFYDYPGHFMDNARGKQLAQIEIERLRKDHVLAQGYSDVPLLHTGYYFTLEEHPSLDATDPWLLNTIIHQGKQPQVTEAFGGEHNAKLTHKLSQDSDASFVEGDFHQGYRNTFTATPKDVPWRPPLEYPKTRIYGSQTAKVVGPKGEEIYCNEYGSVKVQFHWDREGQFDENSSCWVRVGSNWAHKGYGTFTIPRINMEVLITYLEGDPDQPVITGCINNGINTQAEGMPANKTKTGFKTNSSPGGGGSNELTFEDKKGEEQVFIHAQKDMNTVVENNESLTVGVDRTKDIGQDETSTIKRNATRVVKDNDTLKVGIKKDDHIGSEYYIGVGTKLTLECGKTIIELNADGTLNITCNTFNFTANNTGKINTISGVLDLNMEGKAPAIAAQGEASGEIKKNVDSYFGEGGDDSEGSTVEQDQQDAKVHENQLNESGVTDSQPEPIEDAGVVAGNLADAPGLVAEPPPPVMPNVTAHGTADASDVALVQAELAKMPEQYRQAMADNDIKVIVTRNSITEYRADLRGVQPRGWPPGSTWDSVPGLNSGKEVVISTIGHGTAVGAHVPIMGEGHGSQNLVLHESGHAIQDVIGASDAFLNARTADFGSLSAYEKQVGDAGIQETFAESFANVFGGNPNYAATHPNLDAYWKNQVSP